MTVLANRHLAPPIWATDSVTEDGGVTHEHVSSVHPHGLHGLPHSPAATLTTDVSLSVVDRPSPTGWVRAEPTVQVEGGTFTVAEARRLRQALDDLLSQVGAA